jgi:ATP synthase F1 gamma subunit
VTKRRFFARKFLPKFLTSLLSLQNLIFTSVASSDQVLNPFCHRLSFSFHEPALIEKLLPMYVHVLIYRALLETAAGENGARMVAMDNATRNCEEMINNLTLKYNKARQSAITSELMDIVGGTEALAKG